METSSRGPWGPCRRAKASPGAFSSQLMQFSSAFPPNLYHVHIHYELARVPLPLPHLSVLLRSFTETMSSLLPGKPWQTKLSSAGLIYLHFGHKLLAQLLGTSEEDSTVGTLYDKVGTGRQRCPTHASPPGWLGVAHSTLDWPSGQGSWPTAGPTPCPSIRLIFS